MGKDVEPPSLRGVEKDIGFLSITRVFACVPNLKLLEKPWALLFFVAICFLVFTEMITFTVSLSLKNVAMPSIFTQIINGEIPCSKIAEDEHNFAFLDITPNAIGHTLCVPKKEVDKVLDMDEADYLNLMAFSRKVGKAIEAAIPCKRVGIAVIGFEVPHVHVHIIPLNAMRDATFQFKQTPTPEEFEATAEKIRKHFT